MGAFSSFYQRSNFYCHIFQLYFYSLFYPYFSLGNMLHSTFSFIQLTFQRSHCGLGIGNIEVRIHIFLLQRNSWSYRSNKCINSSERHKRRACWICYLKLLCDSLDVEIVGKSKIGISTLYFILLQGSVREDYPEQVEFELFWLHIWEGHGTQIRE